MVFRNLLLIILLLVCVNAYSQQQDLEFHPNSEFLNGKTVLKVKRDFNDPYLWVLAKNNEVYRLNSITLQVDDYTAQFAPYNNLQFIDIAGSSQDIVFVATNSTNVIEYKTGVLTQITVPDIVTSIGISNFGNGGVNTNDLEIGTFKGKGQYDPATDQLTYYAFYNETNIQIFSATYRSLLHKSDNYQYPLVNEYPLANYGYSQSQITTITPISESGNNVTTALCTLQSLVAIAGTFDMNIFWGNEKGMFQETGSNLPGNSPFGHYLNNINVNKITDILGLTGLGNPYFTTPALTLTKQNLLIGTDKGFYFSSSIYGQYDNNFLRPFSLFHYDALGNVKVNDICVNGSATNYLATPTGCEDGVWLACDNGLYLIKPDYAKYFDPKQQLQAINFDLPGDATSINLCDGKSVQLYVNSLDVNNNLIQWVKDGKDIPGANGTTLTVKEPGDYNAILYAPCENIHVETNHLTVGITSAPVFSFNYPNLIQYCDVPSTTLTTDNVAGYQYRWYTNGVLNGISTNSLTVTQTGKYRVEVSACDNSWVSSKEVEVDLINLPVPILSGVKAIYCADETALLKVNVPTDPGYTINWYKDGNLIAAEQNQTSIVATSDGGYSVTLNSSTGNCSKTSNIQQVTFATPPVFTFNYPDKLSYCSGTPVTLTATGSGTYNYFWYKDGVPIGNTTPTAIITQSGKYRVDVSSCDGSWVPSKEVEVDLISIPLPTIQADKPAHCIGDNAKLTINVPADPGYTISWYKDNVLLPANTNQTSITVNENGSYSVNLTANTVNTDGTICTQTSGPQNIIFNPPPTASILQIIKTTLCDGQTIDLQLNYNGGNILWSTGETNDLISVSTSGNYNATVTSAAGCTINAGINVQFFPNPVLNLANTSLCVQSRKTATLTAPAGMKSYIWNGQPGTETYTVYQPGTVTLTITDANGCQATQSVQVTDECADLVIPNTFTPNGDGINDTWDITGLQYDPTSIVKIFNRYGKELYQSRGYAKPWNGEYQGKQLPAGVYYYIISVKSNTKTYSGWVTLVY